MTVGYELVCCVCDAVPAACGCAPTPNRRLSWATGELTAAAFRQSLAGRDVWRYQALLPVDRRYGSGLAIGGTPLIDLGTIDGVRLYAKDDTRNPSGSLKDRATEIALAVARSQGHTEVVTASTGNAGASLACVAAAHGLKATVLVPGSAPPAKLRQIEAYGAELVRVDGSYDDAFDLAVRYATERGAYCRNTGVNPYTREGKKTVAFEIAEQLDWSVPDWVLVPTGDGNIASGVDAGFEQLAAIGATTGSPKLVAAQVDSSDGVARSFAGALADQRRVPVEAVSVTPRTVADSISVARPRDHSGAVRALLRSGGCPVVLSEPALRDAHRTLATRFGLWVEPSAAAALAALLELSGRGDIRAGDTAVLLLTGSGLKDPDAWTR